MRLTDQPNSVLTRKRLLNYIVILYLKINMWKPSICFNNKPHGLFIIHMMVFIIAILVNSKQLRENEKTLILMDFIYIFKITTTRVLFSTPVVPEKRD